MDAEIPVKLRVISQSVLTSNALMHYFGQLEAWLNFKGMSALWYQDESSIILHDIQIMDRADFEAELKVAASSVEILKIKQTGETNTQIYQAAYKKAANKVSMFILVEPETLRFSLNQTFNQNKFNAVVFEFVKRTR